MLALNLAGFPLVAALSTGIGIVSTPLSMTMRTVILALGLILILLAARRAHTAFFRGWYWLPLLWFWTAYVLRLLDDTIFRASELSRPPQDYWIWAIGASLIPALALLTKARLDAYRQAYQLSLAMLSVAAILAVVLGGTVTVSQVSGVVYDTGRLHLESLNPISLGHLGVSLFLLSLWRFVSPGEKSTTLAHLLSLVGAALGLYLTLAAASRGPIVALLGVLLFYALVRHPRHAWKPLALLAAIALIGYIVALRLEGSGHFQPVTRIVGALSGGDVTVSGRGQAMAGALEQFARSPIVGDALEEQTTGFYPHNVIVESFMATGVMGGLPFLVLLYLAVMGAFRVIRSRSEHAWLGLLFMQYLIAAQFSGAIYGVTTMWALLGATIALSCGVRGASAAMDVGAGFDEGAEKWA